MAKIKITQDEEVRFTKELMRAPNPLNRLWRLVLFLLYLAICAFSAYIGQYLFSGLLVFFFGFLYFGVKVAAKINVAKRHRSNRFASEELDVEFCDRVFKVSLGLNHLTFASADISQVVKRDEFFQIAHKSGFTVFLPLGALSQDEIGFIEQYRKRLKQGAVEEVS